MLESLLGPAVPDPDLTRLCEFIFPKAGGGSFGFAGNALPGASAPAVAGLEPRLLTGLLWSVGVGGVLTMTGAFFSLLGGVSGRLFVSILWPLDSRRNRSTEAL